MATTDPVHDIKSRLSILELTQEYLHLTKAGSNWRGLCPFHQEKTPSFMVSEEKQIYHCFGCGEGGDVFEFIKKMEGVEFPEALRILAKKANVPLPEYNPKVENKKSKLLAIQEAATAYYRELFVKHPKAAHAREYFSKRGIDETTSDLFHIGYAPDSWDATMRYLQTKKFTVEEIFDAGLLVKKERGVGYYDRFRNRLMIPIRDVHGGVVGFTSRTLDPDDTSAKYINTPETAVYHKGSTLFNLDLAKTHIKEKGTVIVVEGNMDAIALTQAGFKNVVASSGTAFTEHQIKLIKRFTNSLLLAFDHDDAGFDALKRSIDATLAAELDLQVVDYQDGKDPDESIQKNREGFTRAVEHAKPLGDYLFEKVINGKDVSNIDDKKKIASEYLTFIAKIENTIEQSHYLKRLAEALDVTDEVLREALNKAAHKRRSRARKEENLKEQKPVEHNIERDLERELVGLLLRFPEHLEFAIDHFDAECISDGFARELYKSLVIYYTEHGFSKGISFSEPHLHSFLQKSSDMSEDDFEHESGILLFASERVLENTDSETARKEIKDRIRRVKKITIQSKLKGIERTIRALEHAGGNSDTRAHELSREFSDLTEELQSIELG